MANEDNLKDFKKGFDDRRNIKGRPKGSRNRSTIVREALEVQIDTKDPFTGEMKRVQVVDAMVLAMLKEVLKKGSVQAFKELMDSGYGKILQEVHNVNSEMDYDEAKKILDKLDGIDSDSTS